MEDGRLLYRLKHRWRAGTTHVVFEPQELVEKLAALVPPPLTIYILNLPPGKTQTLCQHEQEEAYHIQCKSQPESKAGCSYEWRADIAE